MNRKDLAAEVKTYIETELGENDTDDIDLDEASSLVGEYIDGLDTDDDEDES